MNFPHDASDFADLVRVVARDRKLPESVVERDYWVTHTLWAVTESGLDVWFKGRTSLSKGFALTERFSKDLDLKIDRGRASGIPDVDSWTSKNKGPAAARRSFYEALEAVLRVPGARVELQTKSLGRDARGADYRVHYPGLFLDQLHTSMRPFVLLEVGRARAHPFVGRAIASWVHDLLRAKNLVGGFSVNEPRIVHCVHPIVTLLDKLDAISSRFEKGREATSFVRHYEDAFRIIDAADSTNLPALDGAVQDLAADMLANGDIRGLPRADDPALVLIPGTRSDEVRRAYEDLGPVFSGRRASLDNGLRRTRDWIAKTLPSGRNG